MEFNNIEELNNIIISVIASRIRCEEEEISLDDTLESLIGKNDYNVSHLILDLYEKFDIKKYDIPTNSEFEKFYDINSLTKFFLEKCLIN